jgi:glycosyltransferase involved in cell wall biosynthesis
VARLVRAEAERLGVEGDVVFAGSRADVDSAYTAADLVLSVSAFEGLSLVHLETLAAGRPLVTTAVAGVEELAAKHDRVRVVDVDASPEVIAAAAVECLAARPAATGGLASDFTTRSMAARHGELYARATTAPSTEPAGLVLVTNNFSTGGAQSSARRLLVALAAAGVPVNAIVIEEQATYPTPGRSALEAAGIAVAVAPRAGVFDPLATARAVVHRIDATRPRAVLFWNVIPEHKVLIADLLVDVPVWDVSPGEMYFASFERYFRRPRTGSPYLHARDYGRLLEGVIVKYESERARAAETLAARVEVVPNGVEVPPRPPRKASADAPARVIGTLSRLSPDKKLEQLIDAVAHACRTGALPADLDVRIAGAAEHGDEAYAAELRARSAGLPITWAGERDASAFLAELDLFAMISEPSGCPNASLEAMAAGLPIVATNAGGASEQVVDGETGRLVPRGDALALGEALGELARDGARRARMSDAAYARVSERFDVSRMASAYARLCLGVSLALP